MADLNDTTHEDQLTIKVNATTSSAIVQLAGDIDFATSDDLNAALDPIHQHAPPYTVVFDLSAVSFFDSSGLAVLINLARTGRSVMLRSPSPTLRRVIEATGLSDLLTIEP